MDYELLDSGNGRRLERFGEYVLDRPDPEVMWSPNLPFSEWEKADAKFIKNWQIKNKSFPKSWTVIHNNLRSNSVIKFNLKLTPFKHTGVFPEQSWQWDLIEKLVDDKSSVLSLFGYTGIASLAALSGGAKVTQVDASRPAITWFKENQETSNLQEKSARIIIDDAIKFTTREIKRGVKYDGIIMDPPVYGHGPHGEVWSFNKDFPTLLDNVSKLLTNDPKFLIVNAYAISSSSTSLANMLNDKLKGLNGKVTHGELTLNEKSGGRILSTGIYAIWTK